MFSKRSRYRHGFSLVEIMIVIVIIGMLAGAVTVNVRSYIVRAKQNAARQEIATLVHAIETFYSIYDRYPTNEEGLAVLCRPLDKIPESLLSAEPIDPWGRPYQYNCPGAKNPYEIVSYGADGREGGDGANTDINSANLRE